MGLSEFQDILDAISVLQSLATDVISAEMACSVPRMGQSPGEVVLSQVFCSLKENGVARTEQGEPRYQARDICPFGMSFDNVFQPLGVTNLIVIGQNRGRIVRLRKAVGVQEMCQEVV